MNRYFEDKVFYIGRLRIVTIRAIEYFPISWLDKLFEAIKVEGEHKLSLSNDGASLVLDTTNSVGIAQALEDMFDAPKSKDDIDTASERNEEPNLGDIPF